MSVRPHPTDPNKRIIDYYPEGRKGKRVRVVVEATKAEALDIEMDLRRMHAAQADRTNPPIGRILPEYTAWAHTHLAPSTVKDILLALKTLKPIFGHLPVSRITPGIIHAYQASRKGRSPATINKEINYLKGIITWMVDNNYAEPLPFRPKMLKYSRPIPHIPHPADIKKFLDAIRPERKAMVLLFYRSGMRFSEVTNLRWEDINFSAKTIHIKGKGAKWRLADLPDEVAELLEKDRQPSGLVFVNPQTGRKYTTLRQAFEKASKAAGVRITPHLLRHACATYLLESTGDLRLVQTVLGHHNVNVTEIYTHVTAQRIKSGLTIGRDYISHLETQKSGEKTDG